MNNNNDYNNNWITFFIEVSYLSCCIVSRGGYPLWTLGHVLCPTNFLDKLYFKMSTINISNRVHI